MTLITFQNGTVVMRDGQVGTGQGCCCSGDCCVCQTFELNHVASYLNSSEFPRGVIPNAFATEAEAAAALASYTAATGWARGAVGGLGPGDGVTFDAAVALLADYGCGDTQTYNGYVTFGDIDGVPGWLAVLPVITVRCCGKIQPETLYTNEPCGFGGFPDCILTAGHIETWPWVDPFSGEVLWPCDDDGSSTICTETPCAPSDPCARGPCVGGNCDHNPLP